MRSLTIILLTAIQITLCAQNIRPSVSVDGYHSVQFSPGEVFLYFTIEDEARLQSDGYKILKSFDRCFVELQNFLVTKDSSYLLKFIKRDDDLSESGGVSETFRLVVRDHNTAARVKSETYTMDGVRVVHAQSHFTIPKESLWNDLMEMAIKDAHQKATKLASLAGMKLSRIVDIQDFRFDDVLRDVEETSEEFITVSCTMRVKYQMKKR